jgi:hypothetical protein
MAAVCEKAALLIKAGGNMTNNNFFMMCVLQFNKSKVKSPIG